MDSTTWTTHLRNHVNPAFVVILSPSPLTYTGCIHDIWFQETSCSGVPGGAKGAWAPSTTLRGVTH